jgi:hypothetical protein
MDRFVIYLTWFRDVSEKYHHLNHSFSFSSFTPGDQNSYLKISPNAFIKLIIFATEPCDENQTQI